MALGRVEETATLLVIHIRSVGGDQKDSALFPEQNQNPQQHRSSDLGPDFKLFNSEPKCLAVLRRLMSPPLLFLPNLG